MMLKRPWVERPRLLERRRDTWTNEDSEGFDIPFGYKYGIYPGYLIQTIQR